MRFGLAREKCQYPCLSKTPIFKGNKTFHLDISSLTIYLMNTFTITIIKSQICQYSINNEILTC